jgi:hypothetical protein
MESVRNLKQEFNSCNILSVEVEHNGFRGGDSGHGGYVKIKFKDLGCTHMELNDNVVDEFDFTFKGNTERETLVEALKYVIKELEEHRYI